MDLLGSIFSDMDKERPSGNKKPKPTPSTIRPPKINQSTQPTVARTPPIMSRQSTSTSQPPAIFKKRLLSENDKQDHDPQAKRDKTMETFKTIKGTNVQTNQFEVHLGDMPEIIERFHMDIFLFNEKKTKTTHINGETKVYGELAKQHCRWALWNIWKVTLQKNQHLFNKTVKMHDSVYDCGASVYFENGVYKTENDKEVTIELRRDDFQEKIWSPIAKLSKNDIDAITIVIVRNRGLGQIYTRGEKLLQPENRNELIRFLELLTSQVTNSRHYFQYGNCSFHRSSDLKNDEIDQACQLDENGTEVKTGFEKTMRMVSRNDGQPKVVMTIDTRRSPFYQEQTVLDLLKTIYNLGKGSHGGRGNGFDKISQGSEYRNRRGNGYSRGSYGGRDGRKDYERHNDDRRNGNNYNQERRDDQGCSTENERKPLDEKDPAILEIIGIMAQHGDDKTNRKLNELRSISVRPKHLPNTKMNLFFIHGFLHESAYDYKFLLKNDDGSFSEISVHDYYLNKYNLKLKYPELPLVFKKVGEDKATFYPMEMLTIERGQRVKQNNISPKIQQVMSGKLSMLPLAHIEKTQDILRDDLIINDNKFLRAFGVKIDEEPTKLTAKVLPSPIIHFARNATTQPITGIGRKPNIDSNRVKFLQPAKLNEVWIINFDEALYRNDYGKFCEAIHQICREQDIVISKLPTEWEVINCYEGDNITLEQIMQDAQKSNISLLLAVTKEQRPDVHDVLKLLERQTGVQTQHVCLRTANTLMAPNGRQTKDNVIRKLNLKCGGLNFSISVPRSEQSKIICENDRRVQQMFFDKTLFIGFELAHAGATCLFDRQNNIACGEPSVVGYSYSCGDPCALGGSYYLQRPREHSLMFLPKHMSIMLANYLSVKKTMPEKVVIYRSGVGEGDFEKVANEVEQMKSVFGKGGKFEGKHVPQFLMVVVSKTSHMRIYPQDVRPGKAFDQNVASGTCVASEITAYGRDEFYLISQTALIGTTRPARYTIITNDPKWTVNEVSHLTYFLAFGHQVSYQPPAVPHILYAAENMAKRGRANLKTHQKLERAKGNVGPREEGRADDDDGTSMETLSSQLNKCAINCKNFWA